MPSANKYKLHHFVYKTLALRVLVASLVIAALLAFLVFIVEKNRITEVVIERAINGAPVFNADIRPLLDEPTLNKSALQTALLNLASGRPNLSEGSYVYAQIYDRRGAQFAVLDASDYEFMDAVHSNIEKLQIVYPDRLWHKVVRIADRPYIQVISPLYNSAGDPVLYLQGLFAVSPQKIQQVLRRLVGTLLGVVVIVLVAALLLYPVILNLTKRLTATSTNLLDSNLNTLEVLGSAITKRDSNTNAHNYRVTILSVKLAEAIGVGKNKIQSLIKGAFLHDVGKIGISDNILLKPGRLSYDEFSIMKTHVEHGVEIVTRCEWLQDAVEVVGHHHEKYDGSGYPRGLAGENIPVLARIFSIIDVFDALSSNRPYKMPYSYGETIKLMEQGRGSHFDPQLLDAFLKIAEFAYYEISKCEEHLLRHTLDSIRQKYFTDNIHSILY